MRWRHSVVPYRVRSSETPSRSEIVATPSSSAVSVRSPTALALVNGVGGKATRPSASSSAFASSYASVASPGTSSGATS